MIDFRYHLVSLISVFLALAVGIVLGAGPLRENLGDQLVGQVEQLRTERDQMRAANDDLTARTEDLAAYATASGPRLVAGTLPERRVAVVTDHDSTRASVESVSTLLQDAGAEVSLRVDLQPLLWSPEDADARTSLLTQLRQETPGAVADGPTDAEALSATIGRLLTADTEQIDTEERRRAWQLLQEGGAVRVDGDSGDPAQAVLWTAADPSAFEIAADDDATAADRTRRVLSAQTALALALVESPTPSVLAATTPGGADTTGMIRAVRQDSRFSRLTTTDSLQEGYGPVIAVLALAQADTGTPGDFGVGASAESMLPGSAPAPSDGGGE
ncbi:copper transporter [Brachybacterium sp. EF45031]|uniref:copper transporter n=1 Tax=Brachybacterium sillae TaxID=2810536 RepID=UPI00217DC212|nr:copper transporter [Brachybacterium sillae]MCS6712680.1 copper transporter [Brachybacterium sillae]